MNRPAKNESAVVQEVDRCPECKHFKAANFDGTCDVRGQSGYECGCHCVFPSTSVSEVEDKTSVSAGKDLATQPTESPHSAPPDRLYLPADTHVDDWIILAKNTTRNWQTGEPVNNVEYVRADLVRAARWMASVVYIHYRNRTDLDPIQQKHLELAMKAGAPFSEKVEAAADTYATNQRDSAVKAGTQTQG